MKKIMFSDRYGLTDAVLKGRKTMTRRLLKVPNTECYDIASALEYDVNKEVNMWAAIKKYAKYHVGEEVAVAQRYKDCGYDPDTLQQVYVKEPTIFPALDPISSHCGWVDLPFKCHKGWNNKMFVRADLMPHRIRITGIKLERLQDISDVDCLMEGIIKVPSPLEEDGTLAYNYTYSHEYYYDAPREAFAALIDKVSGKGTWRMNPYVFVYGFKLVK